MTIDKKSINVSVIYDNYNEYVIPLACYVFGLFIGSIISSKFGVFDDLISIFKSSSTTFLSIFFNRLSVYLCIYCVALLFGLCIVGYPFINIIPLFIGFEIAIKISYYYTQFSVKGFGYSLLLICPEIASFMTVILYSITNSNNLSQLIYNTATKKSDTLQSNDIKVYLKNYMLYSVYIVTIALINAVLEYLLNTIISI